jgi:hypothetical protein
MIERQTYRSAGSHDRIAEIASILAAGLMRLRIRKSSDLSHDIGESSLHLSPPESGHELHVLTWEERS